MLRLINKDNNNKRFKDNGINGQFLNLHRIKQRAINRKYHYMQISLKIK